MQVLITHSWSEDNSGDFAIESAIYKILDDKFGDRISSYVFYSLFDKNDIRFLSHSEAKRRLKNTVVKSSLWGTPPIQYSKLKKIFYVLKSFVYTSFLLLIIYIQVRFFKNVFFFKNKIDYFLNSDLIVVKGGTFIYSPNNISGLIFVLRILFPIILGTILRKNIVIASHSFGPFESKLSTRIIMFFLKKTNTIFCRENVSAELLSSYGCKNALYCPDMAFYHYNKNFIFSDKDNTTFKIAITARPLDFIKTKDKNEIYKNYIDQLSDFINLTLKNGIDNYSKIEIHLVPQVIGPDKREDDYETLKLIYNNIEENLKSSVNLHTRYRRTPNELIDLYSKMNLVIGTRMHSIIFGFLTGIPAIAIAYLGPKHVGIMEEFDMKDYVLDIYTVNSFKIYQLVQKISNDKQLKNRIIDKSRSFKDNIYSSFNLLSSVN